MTATHVDGRAVIADEPTRAPISQRNGDPVYWQQIRTLLLEDESTLYGCVHCDYTAEKPGSIRPHLKKHTSRAPAPAAAADMSLTDLLAKIAQLETVTADRDRWRRRALDAERKLSTMRRALK